MALLISPETLAGPSYLDWPAGADLTELDSVCEAADKLVRRYLDPNKGPHDTHANDIEAAGAVAIQIYNSRKAPGGQMQAVDYQPIITPNLLGPGLINKVMGLLGPCRPSGGLVVG